MASLQDQYDNALLGILQNEGNIVQFLDVCFSFLARRTDFYVRLEGPEGKMGFPEGVAEKLVLKSFNKFDRLAQAAAAKKAEQLSKKIKEKEKPVSVPKSETPSTQTKKNETDHNVPVESSGVAGNDKYAEASPLAPDQLKPNVSCDKNHDASKQTEKVSPGAKNDKTNLEIDPNQSEEEKQAAYQANPDSYNGAMRDAYSWSQSITDVDLKLWVPATVLKGKDVTVDIRKKHLAVCYRHQSSGEKETLVDSDLMWEVHKEESLWSLEPGKCVTINLEKVQERWWEAVFVDEPKINVQKIDPSRPMTDLDDEAQAKIEELMYNDRQKKLGLPQSHEQKAHEMLRKGWDAEGSPFKGQPFDPSQINISSG